MNVNELNNLHKQSLSPSSRLVPMIVFFALILAVSLAISLVGRQKAEPFLLVFMSLLSLIGLWAIFLYVGGWLGHQPAKNENVTTNIIENFPRAIVFSDLNLVFLSSNNAFKALFGNESNINTINQLFKTDRINSDRFYRLAQTGKVGELHSEMLSCEIFGEKKNIFVTVKGEDNKLLWIFEDRTKEVLEQEVIFKNAKKSFQLLDEAPAGFFAADSNGNITYLNQILAKNFGLDLASFTSNSLTLSDIMPASLIPVFTNVLNNSSDISVIDGLIKTKDENAKPVTFYTKIINDNEKPVIFTLVTEKRQNNSPKSQSDKIQAWFQAFFDKSPLGLVIVDSKAEIRRANPAFNELKHSILPGDLTKYFLSIAEDSSKIEISQAIRQAVMTHKTITVDAPFKGDGKRWGKFYISPLDMIEEEGEAAFIYVIDTSEQKLLQEQFAQSQKMQAVGVLAGGVAHDFNNVLQAIIGNSDLMLMNMRTTDIGFSEIREIKSNANRAASLVRQLLAFSRQQTFKVQTLQLNDVIHDMNELIKRSIADKMKLDMQYGRDVWQVKADLTQLEQVVLNLAVNARDAMPQGGTLTIKTSNITADMVLALKILEMPATDYVLLQVTDTGTGMPQHVIDKIFEPFYTTKEVGKGTGLGLSTVYGIIKQSGGFVYVDSVQGQGTSFRIYLPRFIDTTPVIPVAPKIEPIKAPPAPDMTGNGTILYVEDEVAVRAFGVRALTSRGYTVLQAESGIEALELFDEAGGNVDLVISDVVMPEMDGPTLLGELRRRNPKLKVIFASGYAEEAFAKNLPEGEEFHFLAKPFQMATLIKTVKDVIAS